MICLIKVCFFRPDLDKIQHKFSENHVITVKITDLRCPKGFWGCWVHFYLQKPDYNTAKFRFCKHYFVGFSTKNHCLRQIVKCLVLSKNNYVIQRSPTIKITTKKIHSIVNNSRDNKFELGFWEIPHRFAFGSTSIDNIQAKQATWLWHNLHFCHHPQLTLYDLVTIFGLHSMIVLLSKPLIGDSNYQHEFM